MNTQEFRGIKVVFREDKPGEQPCCIPTDGVVCVFYRGPYKCPAMALEPGASCSARGRGGSVGGIWIKAEDEQAQDSTIPSMVAP